MILIFINNKKTKILKKNIINYHHILYIHNERIEFPFQDPLIEISAPYKCTESRNSCLCSEYTASNTNAHNHSVSISRSKCHPPLPPQGTIHKVHDLWRNVCKKVHKYNEIFDGVFEKLAMYFQLFSFLHD